jgi:hypothetical protein
MDNIETTIQDLTLMLMYVSSWEEPPGGARKAWKGFSYEAMDALLQAELITSRKSDKAVALTKEGIVEARDLLRKHGFSVEEQG